MCGIIGQYHLDTGRLDPLCVYEAATLIKHRGPNSEGYLLLTTPSGQSELRNGPDTAEGIDYPQIDVPVSFAPDLVLSQRRLSILDLSPKGHEPMALAGRNDLW